ncbi:folate/biopterin transporter [Halothece sp. PCC 7418]|uniref:folate/biopterin family MFS transporter n=1 Tax=Halothece sp. (strain PCC 7418) TaxID=65093 RepID=UPI0002A08CFC|nr:folate/biopterin family MFS transporter [Halothece sp. PCC 7418]AFZ44066.1 folate/biopterin transporter [Halothece sp. PCC 7418]
MHTFIKDKLFLGNDPTPELIAIVSIYVVRGVLNLARLAISFFLKDELGLSPAEVSALTGLAILPWVIKPLFGFLSDGFPILGYRRRPYLVLSGFLGTTSWLALATVVDQAWTAAIALLISSASIAISDVIVDSQVVERAREESLANAGSLQSLSWGATAFGGLITAYFSGFLLELFPPKTIFAITAVFPLVFSTMAWLIAEKPVPEKERVQALSNLKKQVQQLWQVMRQKRIFLPTLFIFIWQSTPGSDSALFFFITNELGFEPEFLGRVRLVSSFASLAGVWIFQRYLKTVSFRKVLGWSTVISSVLGMSVLLLVTHANRTLGIDDYWFSLGDNLILSAIGEIALMPILVLAARLCPSGIEATFFALMMSIFNLAGVLSQELGGLLTALLGITENNFDRLWLLVILTNLSTLLPLPLINLLPANDPMEHQSSNHV